MMPSTRRLRTVALVAAASALALAIPAIAAEFAVDNTTVELVAVNGAADTANPGTTCFKISAPVQAACTAGFIAVPNNNKQLLAAALQAKGTGSKIWVYYSDSGTFHCSGIVFTPCSAISIGIR